MEELIAFDFIIIYYERVKNLIDGLSQQPDFKDDNELFTIKRQSLPNFLSKFQEYLENMKSDLTKEQSIDFNETPLPKNVLNLIKILQGINFIGVLPVRNESKNDPIEE